ncbi:uncharacterized protein LOC104891937 [Beta vulgaris subsp. vulgaris]|uniref:uncharacterized protein LOC104891937 n=1 Tax=Beta vulgaris subsp. vulgaris TaxID=3555 RepID=UPI00053F3C22|nr:uncharacterized protein LOC104891937 [Beta vulgaris subsp. vulgaris]
MQTISLPYIILGDFNEISNSSDKLGGSPPVMARFLNMQNLFNSLPCIEIPFSGSIYTWRKKKGGADNIHERLDRGVASIDWLSLFPQAKISHNIFTSSDHCQITLNYIPFQKAKAPPFKFEKMWCSRRDYDTLVKKTWCTHFIGSHMFRLTQKCKLLKEKSKIWNQSQFGNIFRQLRKVDEKLQSLQLLLITEPLNHLLLSKQDTFLQKRSNLLSFSYEYWKQKCKVDYLLLGDTNSSFYHAHASIRRNRNAIKELSKADNDTISNPDIISQELTRAFMERFTSDSRTCFNSANDFSLLEAIISVDDNTYLTSLVTCDEIKSATFSLAPDKSPGPDGFPPFFFQKYWTLVGNSVIRAVQAFFHSSRILKEINHTFLALIPKIDNPTSANHFRPISLCSTIYKIISKIMTSRLKIVMGHIIHPLQGAFVPDRLIQDNILIAHEVFQSFKNKSGASGWIAIKLDMEKAYDRLEWNYIFTTLEKLGFAAQWVNWVKACITSTSFSVLVNGIPGEKFSPSRGIRQGDPLSPFLFILCAELLARLLSSAASGPTKPIGVPIGRSGVKVPFLTFADDTMIFAKATNYSCLVIRQILDKYCAMSGQLVNYHKSSFQCTANISEDDKANFASILQMSETFDLGEYLGCPIIHSKVTKETFSSVINKTVGQLPKWKANALSQAGRSILIKSNLASKASYQMQSFLLPNSILSSLDKTYRNFFWNKDPNAKSPNLIGWDKICKPKVAGGLGFRKAEVNNQALQMKLLWRIVKNDTNLWVNLVRKRYLKNRSLFTIKVSKSASWQWRNLLSLRDLFKKGLRWQIGDGSCVRFWSDNWAFQYPLDSIITPTPETINFLVKDCLTANGNWNTQLLLSLVPPNIVSHISSIYLPSSPQQDTLIWGLTSDGEYSVKSGALLAQGLISAELDTVEYKWIWNLIIPPKIKNFLWKACNDGLPTKVRLERSHVFLPQQCVFCSNASESIGHLCFACPFTLDVFSHLKASFDWPLPNRCLASIDLTSFRSALEACLSLACKSEVTKFSFVWWFIWFFRNKLIFNNEVVSSRKASAIIAKYYVDWSKALTSDTRHPSTSISHCPIISRSPRSGPASFWSPPPQNYFKLNFDGSKLSSNSTALGFVIRNVAGEAMVAGSKSLGYSTSVLQAEAWALKEGILAALSFNISNLIIEGDNLAVINAIRKIWKIPWEINNIVLDIRANLPLFGSFQVQHCFREANKVADLLANRGHGLDGMQLFYPPFDIDLSMCVRKDVLGWPPD